MAVSKDTFDLLLLGKAEYRCFSLESAMRSGMPYDNDWVEVLGELYRYARRESGGEHRRTATRRHEEDRRHLRGFDSRRWPILHEVIERSPADSFGPKPQRGLGFPLDGIAEDLRRSIRAFRFRLEKDEVGVGEKWPDGVLGHLRNLSEYTRSWDGPAFCD